jgi:hypothetical protein
MQVQAWQIRQERFRWGEIYFIFCSAKGSEADLIFCFDNDFDRLLSNDTMGLLRLISFRISGRQQTFCMDMRYHERLAAKVSYFSSVVHTRFNDTRAQL